MRILEDKVLGYVAGGNISSYIETNYVRYEAPTRDGNFVTLVLMNDGEGGLRYVDQTGHYAGKRYGKEDNRAAWADFMALAS